MARNLLSISELGAEGVNGFLNLAKEIESGNGPGPVPANSLKARKMLGLLFCENSTRTKMSFEVAAKQLSLDILNLNLKTSSVSKGESLKDTAETLIALGADALVVRHASAGVPCQISRWVEVSVINAGDGSHSHPTQALADCYTIQKHLGGLGGLRILIAGDIAHSRVARSCINAFSLLGANVVLSGPKAMLPAKVQSIWPVEVAKDFDSALETVDVVYLLRIQSERQDNAFLPSAREYRQRFGLTARRAECLKDHTLVMHPGPINRGVEIDDEVAQMDRTKVKEQVTHGVLLKKAILCDLIL